MRQRNEAVDEDAPTTVFIAPARPAVRSSNRSEPEPRFVLSPNDAARLLKVNRKTIHSLLAQGLPHQRLGARIIRIRSSDLLAWGAKNTLNVGK
jgi:excisionase family DNA binding protein